MAARFDTEETNEFSPASPPYGFRTLAPSHYPLQEQTHMIRKLSSGEYRLYSRKKNPKTGKRRNLGTFKSRSAAERHEKAVQFFKRQG
jgi:hypothetical protein